MRRWPPHHPEFVRQRAAMHSPRAEPSHSNKTDEVRQHISQLANETKTGTRRIIPYSAVFCPTKQRVTTAGSATARAQRRANPLSPCHKKPAAKIYHVYCRRPAALPPVPMYPDWTERCCCAHISPPARPRVNMTHQKDPARLLSVLPLKRKGARSRG